MRVANHRVSASLRVPVRAACCSVAREARETREAFLASAVEAGTGRRRASIRCVAGLEAALKRAQTPRQRAGHMLLQQPAAEDDSLATATL
jgi:hypothetical protein